MILVLNNSKKKTFLVGVSFGHFIYLLKLTYFSTKYHQNISKGKGIMIQTSKIVKVFLRAITSSVRK